MKRGNTGLVVLVMVGVVLFLGLFFLLSDSSQPSGYVTLPTTQTPCSSDTDCMSFPYCQSEDSDKRCFNGFCTCVDPCQNGAECSPFGEASQQCGLLNGDPGFASTCVSTDAFGNNGACSCTGSCEDVEGIQCSTIAVSPLTAPSFTPCGDKAHCIITGFSDGTGFGVCGCGDQACLTPNGKTDDCSGTVGCEQGPSCASNSDCPSGFFCGQGTCFKECNTNADCGGLVSGSCSIEVNGNKGCNCFCNAGNPCFVDDNCGNFGEDGNFGQCIVHPDGAKKCSCTDTHGCSPLDCEPGVTRCNSGDPLGCGGNPDACQCSNGNNCVCEACAEKCGVFGEGANEEGECEELAAQTGAECNFVSYDQSGHCECVWPDDLCTTCFNTNGGQACGENE